jgi:tetratricopeptide (TPR) repeat protein
MSLWKGKQGSPSGPFLGQAEDLLKRAIELEPTFAPAHLELANLYSQQHKYSESAAEYKRAIALDPKIVDAYYRLGQAYVHLGQADLAKKEFQIHKQLYQQHLAEWDSEQQEIRNFVYTTHVGGGARK